MFNDRARQLAGAMNLSPSVLLGRTEKHWLISQEYRAERGLKDGYVICHNGQAVGWRRDLDEASGWTPGCYAFDSEGRDWVAVGGTHDDGAERWERIG